MTAGTLAGVAAPPQGIAQEVGEANDFRAGFRALGF